MARCALTGQSIWAEPPRAVASPSPGARVPELEGEASSSSASSTPSLSFPTSPVSITLSLPFAKAPSLTHGLEYGAFSVRGPTPSVDLQHQPVTTLSPTLLGGELLEPASLPHAVTPDGTTQRALEQIFQANPRPHTRATSFSNQPSIRPDPTSYFSPPLASRTRSRSSAPAVDPSAPHSARPTEHFYRSMSGTNGAHPIRMAPSLSQDEALRPRVGESRDSYTSETGSYDPTPWRSSLPSKSVGTGWEDFEREREGRSRLRDAEQSQRTWGAQRDVSVGGMTDDGFTHSGIGLSNMSPFSRDSGRTLMEVNEGGYRARREYSLGAVGSGRKRGDTVWGSSRPLREAEDEDVDDAFAAPTKSGATSRRHSVSAFTAPLSRSIGFNLPDEVIKVSRTPGGGRPSFGHGFGSRPGSSAVNDEDLAADLNSLHLNLEAHVAATSSLLPHVGSMPAYTSRDLSSSRNQFRDEPAASAYGSRGLQDQYDSGSSSAARLFQTLSSGGTASRNASRYEYGSGTDEFGLPTPGGASSFGQSGRYASSFGRPPSPPSAFYPSQGLSAQAPSFQAFASASSQPAPATPSFYAPVVNPEVANLGRGIPLHSVPANAPLYIVEFKAGRKDLFFVEDPNLTLRQGDLVIVEADRGKDIGKFFKPCSLDEVQAFQQRLVELALGQLANPQGGGGGGRDGQPPNAATIARMTKEFSPKKIFGKAQPIDTQLLLSKAQDEVKALALVRGKVAQKSKSFPFSFGIGLTPWSDLAMEITDAEWQWDRRKLTFFYLADQRVDFRELVRELFRLYKTRIWMSVLPFPGSYDADCDTGAVWIKLSRAGILRALRTWINPDFSSRAVL